MHSKGTKILVTALLMISLFFVGCSANVENASTEEQKIPVSVLITEKGSLERYIYLGGLLAPEEEVFLASRNPALRVDAVPVQVGERVKAHTPLVYFDSRELDVQLKQAELNYERNLQLLEAGAVSKFQLEQLEATLDSLRLQKEYLTLKSPIDGIVASLTAIEGQLAGGTPLVSVVNIDKLKLPVQVGEANIGKLKLGAEMAVSVSAASDEPYVGTIITIAPQADARTKAYPVTLELLNESREIKGGMYGEVKLAIESRDDVIVVPQYAVLDYEQKKIVYVVENDKAVLREVDLGLTVGDNAEIVSGLVAGEIVIVEGQYGIKDGSAVSVAAGSEKQ